MNEMSSPQFYSGFKARETSQNSSNQSPKHSNQNQSQFSSIVKGKYNLNNQNINPNTPHNVETIFKEYENLVNTLKSNQYTIEILNSNIAHLQKQFSIKDQTYSSKLKQLQKLRKTNLKITEAIKAQKHRTKKLTKSHQTNSSQLEVVQTQLQFTFEQRLNSQQHKNQIYQQFKDLEEEYNLKMQQIQSLFIGQTLQDNRNQTPFQKNQNDSENTKFHKLPAKQALQKLRHNNTYELPKIIQKKQQNIAQLQSQLQTQLEHRQNIKKNIQKITENIKSYEQKQYQHQIDIQKLQKQKGILTKNQQKVQQKNDYLIGLLQKVQKLKEQLDEKCQQKYGLVKYLKEVEKEQKQMRKIRKIQVECERQQAHYRHQKGQHFTVLESENDNYSPQNLSKESRKSLQNHQFLSPQFNFNNQSDQPQQVQRFDTETRQRLSSIIQKYQILKQKRNNRH